VWGRTGTGGVHRVGTARGTQPTPVGRLSPPGPRWARQTRDSACGAHRFGGSVPNRVPHPRRRSCGGQGARAPPVNTAPLGLPSSLAGRPPPAAARGPRRVLPPPPQRAARSLYALFAPAKKKSLAKRCSSVCGLLLYRINIKYI